MSLRLRLTLFYSAFMAIILSAVALAVYTLTEQSLVVSLEERGRQALADMDEGEIRVGLSRLPGDAYYEIVIYPTRPPTSGADLQDGARYTSLFGNFRPNPTGDDIPNLLNQDALETLYQQQHVITRVRLENGETLFVMANRGSYTNQRSKLTYDATLFIGIPAGGMEATLRQLANDLALTVVSAFLLFSIGVWLLSRQVLSPVQRVTQAAARVTSRDLSQRVPVPRTKDEMQELAVTLNRMLDRLQESFETQRRFTADASHELRTPVTAIVGHSNYLLRRTQPKPEQIDSLTVIRREAERMGKLVNDLLELARADAGFSIDKQPMNLVEVVEAVHMEVAPFVGNTVIEIASRQPVIEIQGDAGRLKQVLLNLVQNAVNAGASRITITLRREKQSVQLEILDDGPGIPEEAIPHLFDRFYRVDGARSSRGNGSGLGLAIVKWIVQEHGGSVSVESRLGEGSVFTITLPVLNPRLTETPSVRQTLHDTFGLFKAPREQS